MAERIYFPDGTNALDALNATTQIHLETECDECTGTGFAADNDSPCDACSGAGTTPTTAGETILWFLRRHWDGMPFAT